MTIINSSSGISGGFGTSLEGNQVVKVFQLPKPVSDGDPEGNRAQALVEEREEDQEDE